MNTRPGFLKVIFSFLIFLVASNYMNGQSEKEPAAGKELYKEIAALDSIVFAAFNTRDIAKFGSMFTKDLEFFHDKGGLTNYEHTMNFMNNVAKENNGLRRELVKGSLEVYPIPGYGAMEMGTHIFCHIENGRSDCGTFKFVHIWKKIDGEWKISRVISYGH